MNFIHVLGTIYQGQKYEIELNVITLMFFCARVRMTCVGTVITYRYIYTHNTFIHILYTI